MHTQAELAVAASLESMKVSSPRGSSVGELSPPENAQEVRAFSVGKSGAGKTTFMNNFFGLPQDLLKPSTTDCETVRLEKHGIKLVLTDTIGGDRAESKRHLKLLKQRYEGGMPSLFFYCISVDTSSKFEDGNPAIMKTLQDIFGRGIWKHCWLIFTFSNVAWKRCLESSRNNDSKALEKYKRYLKQCGSLFEQELNKLGVRDIIVRTTFDEDQATPQGKFKIMALPAGEMEDDKVFTGITSKHKIGDDTLPWRDAVVLSSSQGCSELLRASYGLEAAALLRGLIGRSTAVIAAMAGAGAAIGFFAGPIGAAVGAACGAVGGVVLGRAAGAGAGAMVRNVMEILERTRERKE